MIAPARISVAVATVVIVGSFAGTPRALTQAGTWLREADMPVGRSAHAVVSTGEAIYVLGGTGDAGSPVLDVHRFDGKTWTQEGAIPGEGLNAPAAAFAGGAVYLIGGFGTTTNRPTASVHKYDPRTKAWSEAAPLPAARGGHATAVLNGRIHVVGGGNSVSTLAHHSVYDPATNTWTDRAPLPRSMGSPAAVVAGGRLYSIGGRSGPGDFGDVHIYDPSADAWTPGPSIEPRGTAGAVFVNGSVYLFGGESQAKRTVLADVLRWAPGSPAWTADTPMPTPRNFARAVLFRGAVYTIGGSLQAGASHASAGSRVVEKFTPGGKSRSVRGYRSLILIGR